MSSYCISLQMSAHLQKNKPVQISARKEPFRVPMDYELIALDLDDTLLDPEKRVSERNLRAISAAKDAGARIIIATGRAHAGIGRFQDMLNVHDYTIVTAGAVTMDPEGNIVDTEPIDENTTWELMKWARDRNIYFQLYQDGTFWYETPTEYTDLYEQWNGYKGVHVPHLSERRDIASAKVLFIGSEEDTAQWSGEVQRAFPHLCVQVSDPRFLEISNPAASKGSAMLRLGNLLGIPAEKMIAIGDSPIDKSMIEAAGLGVAVANAVPEVLEAADYVAPSSVDDGVADVIEEFVLGKTWD